MAPAKPLAGFEACSNCNILAFHSDKRASCHSDKTGTSVLFARRFRAPSMTCLMVRFSCTVVTTIWRRFQSCRDIPRPDQRQRPVCYHANPIEPGHPHPPGCAAIRSPVCLRASPYAVEQSTQTSVTKTTWSPARRAGSHRYPWIWWIR